MSRTPTFRPSKRVGLGHGSKRVRVKTGSGQNGSIIKKSCFGSGRNGFGSERVRVGTCSVQNGFRVGFFYTKLDTLIDKKASC
ncbi:hypothetical protein Hanom_Chr14g01285221 [Helianthus anomalus]